MFIFLANAMTKAIPNKTLLGSQGTATANRIVIEKRSPTNDARIPRVAPEKYLASLPIFTPSFVILVAATPFFDRFKAARYFCGAPRGILASFVGLLFSMTIRFAVAVPWEPSKVLFGIALVIALARKMNILYIVLIGSALSIVLFR